ncbi:MAG TPA: PD-(D/E)XK nuclease family protein [Beijerinckiaceae bacterium]
MVGRRTTQIGTKDYRSELLSYLSDLEHELPFCDAERAGSELFGAPRFSFFDALNPDELRLSRLVSNLLNPKGTHGQGNLFLYSVLETVGISVPRKREIVHINREFPTAEGRRIDLVIETKKMIIGIENKPWATQQRNQLGAYLSDLKRRSANRKAYLIFISSQQEKSAIGEITRIPYFSDEDAPSVYSSLIRTLPRIKAQKVRTFVEEFMLWISTEFGDNTMPNAITNPYIRAVEELFEVSSKNRKTIAATMLAHEALHVSIKII